MTMRYKIAAAGDCPPIAAARVMWLSLQEFQAKLPELMSRGFPPPDPTTGNFDMDAINAWRRRRCPQLFGESLTIASPSRNTSEVVRERLARIRGG